jgi:hypothetical protein
MKAFLFALFLFRAYQAEAVEIIDIRAYFYTAFAETLPENQQDKSLATIADQICNTHAMETPSHALKWKIERDFFCEVECEPKSELSKINFKPAPLSKEALDLYKRAVETGGYSVSILQRNNAGSIQTVIILGERHQKTKKESEIGKEFFKFFQVIGFENIQLPQLKDFNTLAHLDGGFVAKYGWATTKKYLPKITYRKEVLDHESTMEDLILGYESLIAKLDKGTQWGIRVIQNYGKTRGQSPILPKTIPIVGMPNYQSFFVWAVDEPIKGFLKSLGYTNEDIIDEKEIHKLVKKASAKVFTDVYQVVDLEAHAPPTRETIQLLSSMKNSKRAALAACASLAVTYGFYHCCTGSIGPYDGYLIAAAMANICAAIAYAKQILNPVLPSRLAIEVDPFNIDPLIDSRDPVLAQGIMNTFELRRELNNHLAIVGDFHRQGVVNELIYRHGFRLQTVVR